MVSVRANIGVGDEFLGYRIDELIGQGGMGVVYRAYDLRLKRIVALKLVTPVLALDERFRERFARETELAMSLEHPNVVPIHDAGDVNGRLYLAMRLVAGTDLRRLLRAEGALEPSRALAICRQLASALDTAHEKGLVHRDVKPSNVLLDESEHAYLADFGLTRRTDEQGAQAGDGRSIGTPAYLAPEQIEGKPVDGRADVYALGCVLFECLTGAPPYSSGSPLGVAWAHLEEEPPSASSLRSDLPEEIDDVVRKALAKEPDDRYPTCAAFVAEAEEAFGLGRPPAFSRRRLVLGLAALVLVLGAAAVAAVLATRGGSAPASSPLFAGADTLARIDPATNAVTNVIAVGPHPSETAVSGRRVWIYNRGDSTISEIDAETRTVLHTTAPLAGTDSGGPLAGPVLAADAGGAWFVGADERGGVLTRIRLGGGVRLYRLDHEPRAVAVGYGTVWIVGRRSGDNELIRVDPSTGRVTHRTPFGSSSIDSIAIGERAVWVVASAKGVLYRIDPRTGGRDGAIDVGTNAGRPGPFPGYVAVATADHGGRTSFIDPPTVSLSGVDDSCCPPTWGEGGYANGLLWWDDWPSGNVYRQRPPAGDIHQIRVTGDAPQAGGPCLTSIAFGAGAVWVTAASAPGFAGSLNCNSP